MKTMTIAPIFILTAALVSMAAAWECFDVCPNAKEPACSVKLSSSCKPEQCEYTACVGNKVPLCPSSRDKAVCSYGEGHCVVDPNLSDPYCGYKAWCPAYCSCNIFHRNCEPCGSCSGGISLTESSDGGIFSVGEGREYQEELSTGCEDYDKWMALTKEEKVASLDIYYCNGDLEVHPDIHAILESLADSNDNDHMSCEEFNNAYDLEGMLERRRRLSNGKDDSVLCLTPDATKTSKSGKDKGGTSKTAKTQGKAKN